MNAVQLSSNCWLKYILFLLLFNSLDRRSPRTRQHLNTIKVVEANGTHFRIGFHSILWGIKYTLKIHSHTYPNTCMKRLFNSMPLIQYPPSPRYPIPIEYHHPITRQFYLNYIVCNLWNNWRDNWAYCQLDTSFYSLSEIV